MAEPRRGIPGGWREKVRRFLTRVEARVFEVVDDLTRVTNDGGYLANKERSGQRRDDDGPPDVPHRGIPGG